MTRHRSYFTLACAILCVLGSPAAVRTSAAQEVLDGIAALVNNEVITFSQVRDVVGPSENNARQTLRGQALVDKIKELRLAALNKLIDRQLILQEFKELQKKGAQIPPHVIDEHIDTIIREQFGNDRQAFVRTLAAQGMTMERFRQQQEEEIIVQAMRGQQSKSSVIIPEAKIREKYKESLEAYTSEDQVHLRMLVLRKGASESDSRRKMMEEIREKIKGGAAFPDLARMYSDDPTTQEGGGDWGWINRRTLNESLTKIAFNMKPGQLSDIIELQGNYYLLYCEERKKQTVKPLSEVHDELEKKLLQEERQKQQQEWVAKLRKKAFIKIY